MQFEKFIENAPDSVKIRLESLKNLRERPDYHPEPNAFEHVKIVFERLANTQDIDLMFIAILHDIAKAETSKINPKTGHVTSPFHPEEAFALIEKDKDIQEWINDHEGDIDRIKYAVKYHMQFKNLPVMREHKRQTWEQFYKDLDIFDVLVKFTPADDMISKYEM